MSANLANARLRPRRSEVDRLLADVNKLRTLTGWQRTVSLSEGLNRTCRWIERHLHQFQVSRYAR